MLDRTPSGRRRPKPHYVMHDPREVRALTKIMGAYRRLSESAHVVRADEIGVVVVYDPASFDALASLLGDMEDDEDGHDIEYSTGGLQCLKIAGEFIEVDDCEHDGAEEEPYEGSLGWTEAQSRLGLHDSRPDGWTSIDSEPSLGSLERVDQSKWGSSSTTDHEDVNEDGPPAGSLE